MDSVIGEAIHYFMGDTSPSCFSPFLSFLEFGEHDADLIECTGLHT